MSKKCLVEGCPRDAEQGSIYCTAHSSNLSLSEMRAGTERPGRPTVDDRYFDDGTKLPGTVPVEDRSFDDGIKLPGTLPVDG